MRSSVAGPSGLGGLVCSGMSLKELSAGAPSGDREMRSSRPPDVLVVLGYSRCASWASSRGHEPNGYGTSCHSSLKGGV